MSKIKILSKQIFEDHVDEVSEEHDGKLKMSDTGFEIVYDGCDLIFDDSKLIVKKENSYMEIEANKESVSQLKTPYGILDLKIVGKKIYFSKDPFNFEIQYSIKFENTDEYINELQIFILNN